MNVVKKLAGYFLLSLFSFAFFTLCFHAVASAQGSSGIFSIPTPTPTATPTPTNTPTPTPTNTPTPTPTSTPTPTPTEIPTPTPTLVTAPTDLEALFTKYSSEYSIDKELLKRIADCESHFNPNANYNDMYVGMYQFSESAWAGARSRMGLDASPELRKNAEESIKTAAYKIGQGEQNAWPNCK